MSGKTNHLFVISLILPIITGVFPAGFLDPALQHLQALEHMPLFEEVANGPIAKSFASVNGYEDSADISNGEDGVINFRPAVRKSPGIKPISPSV